MGAHQYHSLLDNDSFQKLRAARGIEGEGRHSWELAVGGLSGLGALKSNSSVPVK